MRKHIVNPRILVFASIMMVFLLLVLPGHSQSRVYSGSVLNTPNYSWSLWRALAAEDAAAAYDLTLDCLDLSTIAPASGTDGIVDTYADIGLGANMLEIAFFTSSDSENDTFDIQIIAWASGSGNATYGPGVIVFQSSSNACKIGTQVCKKHPTLGTSQASGLWCDTISGTDAWGGVTIIDNAGNRLCRLLVDIRGYDLIMIRIFNAGGGGTECGNVGSIVRSY